MELLWYTSIYYLLYINYSLRFTIVKGECGSEVAWADKLKDPDWISLNETGYCFVNACTIRIKESNLLLNIVNKTGDWLTVTNTTDLFTAYAPATSDGTNSNCSLEDPEAGFFIFFAIVTFIIIISSSSNTVLHLVVKELRTVSGMIVVGICGTIIIVFLCTITTAVFQYLYPVNGNSAICAVFKYIITYFVITHTMVKATYLFHFAYLMYRTYTSRTHKEKDKKLLCIYGVVNTTAGTICAALVIVIDLLHGKTVFAMHNGYCADFFHDDPAGVFDKLLMALLAIITIVGILFFIIGITLYYLTTKIMLL